MFGEKTRHFIKIIAGAYVFYLGIKLLTGMLDGSEKSAWYFYLIAIAFMVFAAVILIFSARALMISFKKDQEELEKQKEAALHKDTEIPSVEGASIKERVSAMNRNGEMGNDEDEEDSIENTFSDSDAQDDNTVAEDKTAGMKSTTFINSYKENKD